MRKLKLFFSMLMLIAFSVGNVWAAETVYTGTVAKVDENGDQVMSDVTWTITSDNTAGLGQNVNATKGAQIGSGSKPTKSLTFETTGLTGTIKKVVVNTSGASGFSGTVSVTVGSTAFQCNSSETANLSTTATDYTFEGNASGKITISWAQTTSKAIYVKTIQVTHELNDSGEEPGGGDEPTPGDDPIPATGDGLAIDFEGETTTYTAWEFVNMTTQQTNSNVTAHGDSYFGTTGGKATASVTTKNKVANPGSITFYYSKTTTNTTTSTWYVQVSEDGTNWTNVGEGQSASANVTRGTWYEMTRDLSSYSNVYVRVSYDGTTATRTIDDVTLTLADGKAAAGLAYATSAYLVKANGSLETPTLSNENGLTVTYTSSNTDVAEVAADGAVTIKAAGKAEITASSAETDTYKAGSAKYTIFVAEQAGTAEDPLTEASAKALIVLGCTLRAHVKGTVATVGTLNTTYGSITLTLTDGLQFYGMLNIDGDQFAENPFVIGDVVTAVGTLTKYSNTKYELDTNCQLVEREAYTAPKEDISNTAETAYTPARAIELYNDVTSDLTKEVYVKGVVVATPALTYNESLKGDAAVYNGTYNVYVKAEGDVSENPTTFEFYRMFADGENATFENGDIQVGDLIIAKGTLSKYNSTYEFAQGCQMVWKKPVATIAIDNMALEFEEEKTISATITPEAAVSTVSYSIKEGSDDCITLEDGKVTAKSTAGTATIIATIAGTEDYEGATKEFTVTVAAPDTRKVANSAASGFTATSGNLEPAYIAFESFRGGNSNNDPIIYSSTNGLRLYQLSGTNQYGNFITLTAVHGCKIDQVQITTTSSYATTVAYSVDGNETLSGSKSVAKSDTYSTQAGLNTESVNILNLGSGSSGRLEIASIKVWYTGEAATIDHYDLGGTYKTEFETTDEFNHEGLIVYAAYDAEGTDKVDITAACTFSEPDMSTIGEQTVEITYKGEVVKNYTITVKASTDTRKIANSPASFTAASGNMEPADISFATYKGGSTSDPYLTNGAIRLYQISSTNTFGGFITLKAKKGCEIDQVKITTTNTYATTVAYSVDGNETLSGSENVAKSGTYSTPTGLKTESVNILNLGSGSDGRLEIASIKVWYTGEALPIDHYFLGGEYEKSFPKNGEFNFDGLTVTAAYDAEATITEPVTGFTVEADLSTEGPATAYVYLDETKIAEYKITVTEGKDNPALVYTPSEEEIAKEDIDSWTAPELSNTFNVDVVYFTNKASVATVTEDGVITLAGGTGTAVITASFGGDDNYIASSATYTITVTGSSAGLSGKWVVATNLRADMNVIVASVADGEDVKTLGAQNANNRAAVASRLENGLLKPLEGTEVLTLVDAGEESEDFEDLFALRTSNDNYLYAASNSSNHMKEQDNINEDAAWSIKIGAEGVATIKAKNTKRREWMRYNSASSLFSCYDNGQDDIMLYVNADYDRAVTAGRYGTICLPNSGVIEGATLYEVAYKDASKIYFDEVLDGELQAGVPYIFQPTVGTHIGVVYTGNEGASATSANGLVGYIGTDAFEVPIGSYILNNNQYRLVEYAESAFIQSNRAYINLDVISTKASAPAPNRRRISMGYSGAQVATGIGNVQGDEVQSSKLLINGQLFILRGEKMYDATGRLVK